MKENGKVDDITQLKKDNRQLQKDLLSERLLRINFQMQLLGLMRDETQKTLQGLQEATEPETPS